MLISEIVSLKFLNYECFASIWYEQMIKNMVMGVCKAD